MSGAGIDRYPGWDSLRHIELMLHLEERLGIAFSAGEMERTTQYNALCELVGRKLAAGA